MSTENEENIANGLPMGVHCATLEVALIIDGYRAGSNSLQFRSGTA